MRSVLIVKMSALGDVVMALPALAALRRRYPEAQIDWLVEGAASTLLIGHPDIHRVLISPRKRLSQLAKSGQLTEAARLLAAFIKELRAMDYDVVIDLQGLIKSALWVWLAKGARKIGFTGSRERTGFFLNEKMPPYDPERHAALRYLDAAIYLGAAMPEPLPERYYAPPPEAMRGALALLGNTRDYIVLNPGAKWATKRWPIQHWQQLARLLSAAGKSLVITGGPEDAPSCAAICEAAPTAINLCARTDIPTLAAIMEKSALLITADTGPMHLAAAVGARGLAIFGPTRPNRTGPFGGRFRILTPKMGCLGCLRRVCEKPCLATVAPEEVFAKIQEFCATI